MLRLQIENTIKQSGLVLTKMRKKVLLVFFKNQKPLDAKSLQSSVGYIDRVTLFRILNAFEEHKIIHIIRLEDGRKLFALCNQDCSQDAHSHKHIHFECERCEDVSCLPITGFPQFNIPNYIINNISININGICLNCNS